MVRTRLGCCQARAMRTRLRLGAVEARLVIAVSASPVSRDLRVGTERARAHAAAVERARGGQTLGRLSLLHPALERAEGIDLVRTLAAPAVVHPRCHEQADVVPRHPRTELRDDGGVVLQRAARRDQSVAPAVPEQQSSAARGERAEVGIARVDRAALDPPGALDVPVEVERERIPAWLAEHEVAEVVRADGKLPGVGRPLELARRLGAGQDLLARARVRRAAIHPAHGLELRPGETAGRVTLRALEAARIEVAARRIPDDAIDDSVGGIAGG